MLDAVPRAAILSLSLLLLAGLAAPASPPAAQPVSPPHTRTDATAAYDVLDYAADLDVRPAAKTVAGEVAIRLAGMAERLEEVELEAPELTIMGVWSGDRPLPHQTVDGRLRVRLPDPLRRGETATLRVRYQGSPTRGVHFAPEQVYTFFHTNRWLVSKSHPGDKATLTLRLTLPAELTAVASGRPVGREPLPDGRVRHTFREDRPYSAYLFGFAAARFQEASARAGEVELQHLSSGFSPEQMQRVFAGTGEMLRFFERRAGVPYPSERYSQVLLPGAPPQEMNRLSLMSESYGRAVLEDPREDYLVAHELTHQWWGNLVTCEDWSDFWLNEGIATYMVAAWKEHHWGAEEYRREMLMARLRYARAAAEGPARPLVYTGWTTAEEMGGPITYNKGALVLHLLRRELGDHAFWEGLRLYTRTAAGAGRGVRTRDLQTAMEKASGRELAWFFDQWAYGVEPELVARHRQEPGAVVVEIEQRGPGAPWRIATEVAVETATERVSRRVELRQARQEVRIPVSAPALSVRIDGGGDLPRTVAHERPWEMLLHQMIHEPDPAGRADALLALADACGGAAPAPGCAGLPAALEERAAEDGARVVRQLAERSLQRLRPAPAQ